MLIAILIIMMWGKQHKFRIVISALVGFLMISCGGVDSTLAELDASLPNTPIKISYKSNSQNLDSVAIFANVIDKISPNTFEYCLGAVTVCQVGSPSRKKLTPLRAGAFDGIYKIPEVVTLSTQTQLNLFAVGSANQQVISVSYKFVQAGGAISTPTVANVKFPFSQNQLLNNPQHLKNIDYDYSPMTGDQGAATTTIRIIQSNPELSKEGTKLGAVFAGYNIEDTDTKLFSSATIQADADGALLVTANDLPGGEVYKLHVHFFHVTGEGESSAGTYVGTYKQPLLIASASGNAGQPLDNVRSSIVNTGFAELHDWNLNRYDRSKGYTDDPGYGWCHMFYNYTIKRFMQTSSSHTFYNKGAWQKYNAYKADGGELKTLGQSEKVYGDFFHVGSHVGMVLGYDQTSGDLITLEGNFNDRVMLHKRAPYRITWFGHINDSMLRSSK